jgi:hypothetical protein
MRDVRLAHAYDLDVEALLAFGAALLALRLGGGLVGRYRANRRPELAAWAASLVAYAVASGALAAGAAGGWGEAAFRVYYLFGGLLTAALLGAGSLLLVGRRWAAPLALVYVGLAVGVALAAPLTADVSGTSIPDAQEHLEFFPARLLAVVGNSLGTLAAAGIAIWTIRRRPVGNGPDRGVHRRRGDTPLRRLRGRQRLPDAAEEALEELFEGLVLGRPLVGDVLTEVGEPHRNVQVDRVE